MASRRTAGVEVVNGRPLQVHPSMWVEQDNENVLATVSLAKGVKVLVFTPDELDAAVTTLTALAQAARAHKPAKMSQPAPPVTQPTAQGTVDVFD